MKEGLKVKVSKLKTTKGMMINPKYLETRAVGKTGRLIGYVPGLGGDVWWVRHDGNPEEFGAYSYTELKKV